MNIPSAVKIGGVTYTVEITDKLDLGKVSYSGEIDYCNLAIRVCPNAQKKMEVDFLHELMRGIYEHLGYDQHDEKKIDELAHALYMVIEDNPDMFNTEKIDSTKGE